MIKLLTPDEFDRIIAEFKTIKNTVIDRSTSVENIPTDDVRQTLNEHFRSTSLTYSLANISQPSATYDYIKKIYDDVVLYAKHHEILILLFSRIRENELTLERLCKTLEVNLTVVSEKTILPSAVKNVSPTLKDTGYRANGFFGRWKSKSYSSVLIENPVLLVLILSIFGDYYEHSNTNH